MRSRISAVMRHRPGPGSRPGCGPSRPRSAGDAEIPHRAISWGITGVMVGTRRSIAKKVLVGYRRRPRPRPGPGPGLGLHLQLEHGIEPVLHDRGPALTGSRLHLDTVNEPTEPDPALGDRPGVPPRP